MDTIRTRSKLQQHQQQQLDRASPVNKNSSSPSLASPSSTLTKQIEDMEKRILSSIDYLFDSKLSALKKSILDSIDQKLDAVKAELHSVMKNVAELEMRLNALKVETSKIENYKIEIDRCQRLTDIVITGIPTVEGENPLQLYSCIAKCIGITPSPYIEAFRIKPKSSSHGKSSDNTSNNRSKRDFPIVVKLSCPAERKALLNALRARKTRLTLQELHCGFISDSRINIFESLLPSDDKIRKKAHHLRKANKLHSVHILHGAVYVKCRKGDRLWRIFDDEQLETLITTGYPHRSDREKQQQRNNDNCNRTAMLNRDGV